MNNILLKELRGACEEYEQISDSKSKEKFQTQLMNTCDKIMEFVYISRKEGLLAFDEHIETLRDSKTDRYMALLTELIVDGTNEVELKEVAMYKYFSSQLVAAERLSFIITYYVFLSMIRGENPVVNETKLLVLLPDEISQMYLERRLDNGDRFGVYENEKVFAKEDIEILFKGGLGVTDDMPGYMQIKEANDTFSTKTTDEIIRISENTSNVEFAMIFKVFSGVTRKRFLECITEERALEILKEMQQMGPVRISDIADTTSRMMEI